MNDFLIGLARTAGLIGIALAVLFAVKIAKDFLTPFDDAKEIESDNNIGYALSRSGIYFAVILGMAGSLTGPMARSFGEEALSFAIDGVAVAFGTLLGQYSARRMILPGVSLRSSLAEKNVAVGAVEFAIAIAIGLISFGSFAGEGGGFLSGVVFMATGVAALGITLMLFDRLAGGCIKDIREGNMPAALVLSAQVVSCGILLQMAINGPTEGWATDFKNMAIWFALGLVFNLLTTFLVDLLFLPKSKRSDWVTNNHSAPALMQATIHIALSGLIAVLL